MMDMEKRRMLQYLDEVSFAVNDVNLYLDTHPQDMQALQYFETFRTLRLEALNEYARCYGPMLVDQVQSCNYWSWVKEAWPWEGEV